MMPVAKTTSFRLPARTRQQIEALAEQLGMTRIQVVIMAIDQMSRNEETDTISSTQSMIIEWFKSKTKSLRNRPSFEMRWWREGGFTHVLTIKAGTESVDFRIEEEDLADYDCDPAYTRRLISQWYGDEFAPWYKAKFLAQH